MHSSYKSLYWKHLDILKFNVYVLNKSWKIKSFMQRGDKLEVTVFLEEKLWDLESFTGYMNRELSGTSQE